MKRYTDISDLLEDPSFKAWVLDNDSVQKAIWEKWKLENPDNVEMLLHAQTILKDLNSTGNNWDSERKGLLFTKISKRIRSENDNSYHVYTSYSTGIAKLVRKIIIAFLLLVSFAAFFTVDIPEEVERVVQEVKVEEWTVKSNPRGQKSTIYLPDGSTVVLNSESEIRFTKDYGFNNRDVFIKGEAFFEVASDSLLPFRVFSGELVTVALGTSFNINTYDKTKEHVQLATGKVKVYKDKYEEDYYYLSPGEEILFADRQIRKRNFNIHKAFLWKNGILVFEQTPFSEAILTLERWYAVDIKIENKPARERKVSGEFKDTYLSDLLESLGYAYGFDYQVNNKEVLIKFNRN